MSDHYRNRPNDNDDDKSRSKRHEQFLSPERTDLTNTLPSDMFDDIIEQEGFRAERNGEVAINQEEAFSPGQVTFEVTVGRISQMTKRQVNEVVGSHFARDVEHHTEQRVRDLIAELNAESKS